MALDQNPTTAQPVRDDITLSDPEATNPGQGVVSRGEGDSGDSNDESKTGREAERLDSPAALIAPEPPVRRRGEGDPDENDEPKAEGTRIAPRLQ